MGVTKRRQETCQGRDRRDGSEWDNQVLYAATKGAHGASGTETERGMSRALASLHRGQAQAGVEMRQSNRQGKRQRLV